VQYVKKTFVLAKYAAIKVDLPWNAHEREKEEDKFGCSVATAANNSRVSALSKICRLL
jgi:hypothetical protein